MKRLALHLRCILAATSLALAFAPGCGKKADPAAVEAIAADSAITEKHDAAEVTWRVSPEGEVAVKIRNKDDLPIPKGVSGSVTVKRPDGGVPIPVPLVQQDSGILTAKIPKLTADLTEVSYDLGFEGGKVQGTLHVPRGGSKELVDSAREAASAKKLPPDAKGPNGGIVQVVGDDIVEVVGDKDSGAVRMYILDDDMKPVPVLKRKGKLAFGGPSAEIVDLGPDPGGMYLSGKVTLKAQPAKLTIVVVDGDEVDVALCHYSPGSVIVLGPAAPVLVVFVVTGWPVILVPTPVIVQPGVVIHHKGKGKGKGKFWGVKVW